MSPSRLTVEAWPVSEAGQAAQNEDYVLIYQPSDEAEARLSGSLYVVADGLGGGARGQTASRYAAEKVMEAYFSSDEPDLGLRLRMAVELANADLFAYAQERPELVKVGAALVAVAVRGEQLHVASVGDSRAYIIRDGQIRQITRDHTLIQQLVDEGAITPAEAVEHPRREVVLRALGAEESVAVDVFDLRLKGDDVLLLCTDGLTEQMQADEIAGIVSTASPRSAAEMLVRKAADRGGHNITVVSALLRDGAPSLGADVPHTWDRRRASFDEQPTLAVPRVERPAAPPAPAMEPPRPQPAPAYEQEVRPAPSFAAPPQPAPTSPGAQRPRPAQPEVPPGTPIDPATGLPPVPPPSPEQPGGWTGPQPSYTPRIYKPPQASLRQQRRGVSAGVLAVFGAIAVLLTVAMVVLLVNPLGWDLPFGGEAAATEPTVTSEGGATSTQPVAPATGQPTPQVTPATPTLQPDATVEPPPPGMALVDGGPFLRGVTDDEATQAVQTCIAETEGGGCYREWFTDAQPIEEVTLSPFFMDITEVTNVAYAACVNAGVCEEPDNTEFYADPAFGQHPVVYVSYDQATAYCGWLGRRLPTEAEWEKAARWDPSAGAAYIFPWGDTFEAGIANTEAAGLGGLSAVQAFARDLSPHGVLGMGGNASEWVQDWYFDSYDGLGTLNPARLGAQPLPDPYRVARGGSFQSLQHFVRAGHRLDMPPSTQVAWLGFRCASNVGGQPAPTGTPAAGTPTGEATEGGTATLTPTLTPSP